MGDVLIERETAIDASMERAWSFMAQLALRAADKVVPPKHLVYLENGFAGLAPSASLRGPAVGERAGWRSSS